MLSEKHREHLRAFNIPEEILRSAKLESVNDTEARSKIGVFGRAADDLSGIFFPYLSPVNGDYKGGRIRLDKKTEDDAKYLSEIGCRHLFFAPIVSEALKDSSVPIIIVEAEKSALAVAGYALRAGKKLLPIAIGGCWGWRRADGKEPTANGGTKPRSGPSPDFDLLKWESRTVVIAFDSNVISNQKVQAARAALAKELAVRGALILIASVPALANINGPDDLIAIKGDAGLMKLLLEAKSYNATENITKLEDMPESVLDGRLGDICQRHMDRFPVAYAWTALVAVASALVPRSNDKQRLNIYTALVGDIGSGKTETIQAAQGLLGIEPPRLLKVMAGSAEGLMRRCKDAAGAPRLLSPDELSHLLEKSQIEHASFNSILNSAFYDDKFEITMAKKESVTFNASLSILGGLVENRFGDLFDHSTTGGLYDRFLFGAYPGNFEFEYFPFEEKIDTDFSFSEVRVHPEVWYEKKRWRKENPELNQRVIEIALRVAIICAAFDGRSELTVGDLLPARELAEYSQRIRRFLKPNEGESPEGRIALKILAYLNKLDGHFVTKRVLLHDTGAYRIGPSVAERALRVLNANNDIEVSGTRPVRIRKYPENGDGE